MKWSPQTIRLVDIACKEDLGRAGDITSALLPESAAEITGRIVARQRGVVCGLELGPLVCRAFAKRLGRPIHFLPAGAGQADFKDADHVSAGTCVAVVRGPRIVVLACERTLLNFLGRLSGVATLTRRFVELARRANPEVAVFDTRKTLPGWRELDKYAVRCGGGTNHRHGLYDAVLLKDNHLAGIPTDRLASFISEVLGRLTLRPDFVEVEVDNLEQMAEVCRVPDVNAVLLDNFTPEQLRAAVDYRNRLGLAGKLALEASGGVTLENIGEIAATGVDRISVGALTHSAAWLDLGLDF